MAAGYDVISDVMRSFPQQGERDWGNPRDVSNYVTCRDAIDLWLIDRVSTGVKSEPICVRRWRSSAPARVLRAGSVKDLLPLRNDYVTLMYVRTSDVALIFYEYCELLVLLALYDHFEDFANVKYFTKRFSQKSRD